jgi:uncharacterized protein (AIM24 family)
MPARTPDPRYEEPQPEDPIMNEWYVAVGGQQRGPLAEEQLVAELRSGALRADAYVYGAGLEEWTPVAHVPALARHLPGAAPAAAAAPSPAATAAAPAGSAASAASATPLHAVSPRPQRAAGGADEVPSHSLAEFVAATEEKDQPGDIFELEGSHMLEVHVRGRIWSKLGAMVAYRGNLKFIREGMLEGGLGRALTKFVSGEAAPLTKIEGQGICYLADQKKNITILRLGPGDAINVNGNDLLAFEDTIQYQITMHRRVAGMLAGGLFSLRLSGHGMAALVSHGAPLTLRVRPNDPVITDPNATVAWSGNLAPEIRTDISFRSLIGRGGGEAFQMLFQGDGFVVVQPYEEVPVVQQGRR